MQLFEETHAHRYGMHPCSESKTLTMPTISGRDAQVQYSSKTEPLTYIFIHGIMGKDMYDVSLHNPILASRNA